MAKRVTKGNLWGFIQSRPYASVADIRRLFMMDVDGAAAVPTNEGAYYIGLPQDTADIIRQLWQEGRIILDLNPDVKARVVQGVYPARRDGINPIQNRAEHMNRIAALMGVGSVSATAIKPGFKGIYRCQAITILEAHLPSGMAGIHMQGNHRIHSF